MEKYETHPEDVGEAFIEWVSLFFNLPPKIYRPFSLRRLRVQQNSVMALDKSPPLLNILSGFLTFIGIMFLDERKRYVMNGLGECLNAGKG